MIYNRLFNRTKKTILKLQHNMIGTIKYFYTEEHDSCSMCVNKMSDNKHDFIRTIKSARYPRGYTRLSYYKSISKDKMGNRNCPIMVGTIGEEANKKYN